MKQKELAILLLTKVAGKVTDIPKTGDALLKSIDMSLRNAGATLTTERAERWAGGTIADLCAYAISHPCMPSGLNNGLKFNSRSWCPDLEFYDQL